MALTGTTNPKVGTRAGQPIGGGVSRISGSRENGAGGRLIGSGGLGTGQTVGGGPSRIGGDDRGWGLGGSTGLGGGATTVGGGASRIGGSPENGSGGRLIGSGGLGTSQTVGGGPSKIGGEDRGWGLGGSTGLGGGATTVGGGASRIGVSPENGSGGRLIGSGGLGTGQTVGGGPSKIGSSRQNTSGSGLGGGSRTLSGGASKIGSSSQNKGGGGLSGTSRSRRSRGVKSTQKRIRTKPPFVRITCGDPVNGYYDITLDDDFDDDGVKQPIKLLRHEGFFKGVLTTRPDYWHLKYAMDSNLGVFGQIDRTQNESTYDGSRGAYSNDCHVFFDEPDAMGRIISKQTHEVIVSAGDSPETYFAPPSSKHTIFLDGLTTHFPLQYTIENQTNE